MKVGVLQFFAWPDRRVPLQSVYERALRRIEVMDRSGYEAVWLAEHHFQSFSVCPSIHMMATMVAARTRRLRIGTAVSLAAFYHPLRLAEEVALDVLSGGRVNWGAGRGFHRREFAVFDVPPEESDPAAREVPIARLVAIGDTAARAEEVARRGARWLVQSYVNAEAMAPAGRGAFLPFGDGDPVERYMKGVIVHGTADAVADELRRLEADLPLWSLLLAPLSEETFHRFTDDVLPQLATGF